MNLTLSYRILAHTSGELRGRQTLIGAAVFGGLDLIEMGGAEAQHIMELCLRNFISSKLTRTVSPLTYADLRPNGRCRLH